LRQPGSHTLKELQTHGFASLLFNKFAFITISFFLKNKRTDQTPSGNIYIFPDSEKSSPLAIFIYMK